MHEIKIPIFGVALDPLDAPEKVEVKLSYLEAVEKGYLKPGHPQDPYDLLAGRIREIAPDLMQLAGKLEVEDWLRPRPTPISRFQVKKENFTRFLDEDGCLNYALKVRDLVTGEMLSKVPFLIGVDHSLTGGTVQALSEHYGSDNLALVVIDAHTDALPLAERADFYRWMQREGLEEGFAGDENILRTSAIPNSYNCGSFLHYLLSRGFVHPQNLLMVGVADRPCLPFPRKETGLEPLSIQLFRELEEQGVGFIDKRTLMNQTGLDLLSQKLKALEGKAVYLTIDMDVGALTAVKACRFMDLFGLGERQLLSIANLLGTWIAEGGVMLAGLDVMEIDVHLAGVKSPDGSRDQTPRIALQMLSRILRPTFLR
jgi:arginase family enzyme